MRRRRNQRGSAILEFTLAGIPSLFLILSVVQLSIAMWNYVTLAHAVRAAARYAAVHGNGCSSGGNSCATTVGLITGRLAADGIGVPSDTASATLTTASGQTQTCSPISSCFTNSTVWPPASNNDNMPGQIFTISAQYSFPSAIGMLWPGAQHLMFGTIQVGASTTQIIQF
ncbi:MAG TPA: TadE/TadG family type IV pilus assembly protein [Bryobacteraceae bacterium]|nr:TadE/TadG family type IV pilus assembly protein [Bryobacteraceae bacterium]